MTTVTITDDTHRKLKKLKDEKGIKSFDELLDMMAEEKLDVPSSEEMFGSMTVENKEEIRGHEDRSDRYD